MDVLLRARLLAARPAAPGVAGTRIAAEGYILSPEDDRAAVDRIRATFHVSHELLEESRDAVVFLSGPPTRLTLSALVEEALRRELDQLCAVHMNGARFPTRETGLRPGRPIGS